MTLDLHPDRFSDAEAGSERDPIRQVRVALTVNWSDSMTSDIITKRSFSAWTLDHLAVMNPKIAFPFEGRLSTVKEKNTMVCDIGV